MKSYAGMNGYTGPLLRSHATTKKYEQGSNPCGKCQSYHHLQCRPRLDGTVCSCGCPRAEAIRQEYEASGGDLEMVCKFFAPNYKQLFLAEKYETNN